MKVVLKARESRYIVYHVQRRVKPLGGMWFKSVIIVVFKRRKHARKFAKR